MPQIIINLISWAVLPNKWNSSLSQIVGKPNKKEADVFYIYPTLFIDKKDKNWNSDIYNPITRKDVIEKAVVKSSLSMGESSKPLCAFLSSSSLQDIC